MTCPSCSGELTITVVEGGATTDRHRFLVDVVHTTPPKTPCPLALSASVTTIPEPTS